MCHFASALDCWPAVISLSPYNPNSMEPLEIERDEDFSIISSLEFQCPKSLSTLEKWTIEPCPTSSCAGQVPFEQPLTSLTLGELYIPAQALNYGIHRVNLTVTIQVVPRLVSLATTYVRIVPSPIIVRLVQFGAVMIRRGQEQTLTLDPGTFSIDPDQSTFNSSVTITASNHHFSDVLFAELALYVFLSRL